MTPDHFHGTDPCSIIELRQYTLHSGQREALIELFDREFVESQEAVGMTVMGQFRDIDDADRFVWMRGFSDMETRQAGLAAFYGGPVWGAHREAANETMVDSDNVLLLTPAWPGAGLAPNARARAESGSTSQPAGMVDATIFYLREPADERLLALCRDTVSPTLKQAGVRTQGWYVTEPTPNNFPRLPVREGEPVLVRFAVFADLSALESFDAGRRLADDCQMLLGPWLGRSPERHRLQPTARSALHA
ncbi:MAG: NIPSNAP family protein [Vicinamibacteria bacterium]